MKYSPVSLIRFFISSSSLLLLNLVCAQQNQSLSSPKESIIHQTEIPQQSIPWKKFTVINNQWGISKIKRGTFSQSIYTTKNHVGWEWSSPRKSYGVIAYPEILLGTHAWTKRAEVTQENYFKKIDELTKFTAQFTSEITVNNLKYNIAFDIWLHNEPFVAAENIAIELMIWEDHQKFKPFGKKIKTLNTPFGNYDLYVGKLNKKDIGLAWNYIAFLRHEKRTSGQVDILYLLTILQEMNLIKDALYLSSIEFGTEVLNSTGSILIKEYNVDVH